MKQNSRGAIHLLVPVFVIILAIGAIGYLIYQNNQLRKVPLEPQPTPTSQPSTTKPITSPAPISDPTANWKAYTNSEYSYSIKYPPAFKTQILAAGAGTKETPPDTKNLYIYNPETEESYINRYINLEVLGLEPTYGSEWITTQVSLGSKSATKLVNSNQTSDFDIYLVQLGNNQGVLEIYVSGTQDKKSLSNQILSTFQFTN